VSRPALARDWPTRPVRIVVPYAPGGSTDTVARITADQLSRIWGQQVVIENKPGAGTNIAAAAVASSDPYGYTIFIGSPSLVTSRLLYRSLPYAPSDLAPVTLGRARLPHPGIFRESDMPARHPFLLFSGR
jgi:tripartite-type tricarboxylate transporter receptor subunit TctC